MGVVVFNYKRCDNARMCPVIEKCALEMNVPYGEGAVYFDEDKSRIRVDTQKCSNHNCKTQVCVKDCADCFTYTYNSAQKWWAEQEIHKTERVYKDGNQIADRFNAEDTTLHARISPEECYKYVCESRGLLILEIAANSVCCSAYDSIQLLKILDKNIYHKYYRKVVLYNEKDIIRIEGEFKINELPALVFFFNGERIGLISGIYRHCEDNSEELLKNKISKILLPLKQHL